MLRYFFIALAFFLINCQVITVPKKKQAERVEVTKDSTPKIEHNPKQEVREQENRANERKFAVNTPYAEFNLDNTRKFESSHPFTNFEAQNYTNPVFTTVIFLRAVLERNFDILLESSFNNSPLYGINTPMDHDIWWGNFSGWIGGLTSIRQIYWTPARKNEIYFKIKKKSANAVNSIIVLRYTDESSDSHWKVWNHFFDVKIDNVEGKNVNFEPIHPIWQGNWQPFNIVEESKIEEMDELVTERTLIRIFQNIRNELENIETFIISNEILDGQSDFILGSNFLINDSKRSQYKLLLQHYSTIQLKSYHIVSSFFVHSNFRIETSLAVFDSFVHQVLYIKWFIIHNKVLIYELEILNPEKHHISITAK